MMIYNPEKVKLSREVQPWLRIDLETLNMVLSEDAPEDIKEKYKKMMELSAKEIRLC